MGSENDGKINVKESIKLIALIEEMLDDLNKMDCVGDGVYEESPEEIAARETRKLLDRLMLPKGK
jgi:hypothetical protein